MAAAVAAAMFGGPRLPRWRWWWRRWWRTHLGALYGTDRDRGEERAVALALPTRRSALPWRLAGSVAVQLCRDEPRMACEHEVREREPLAHAHSVVPTTSERWCRAVCCCVAFGSAPLGDKLNDKRTREDFGPLRGQAAGALARRAALPNVRATNVEVLEGRRVWCVTRRSVRARARAPSSSSAARSRARGLEVGWPRRRWSVGLWRAAPARARQC